ncbi:MAG TPA: MBL fold metallo-hydrolase [Chloroflexota bacterium]|nr:MBL fold metallo-hydrolase [Chloroflexota bacterium]
MTTLDGGVVRVTLPMPSKPGHVHAYLLPGSDGWTLVDTGLGLPDAQEQWSGVLDRMDGEVARIFITHFHPDHVGASADLVELTSAPLYQGSLDFAQCTQTWSSKRRQDTIWEWLQAQGMPDEEEDEMRSFGETYRRMTRYATKPILVEPGDRIDGWELIAAPGHADGQLMLLKGTILVAGDHILPHISPAIGLWPDSSSDPLGDYLGALRVVPQLGAQLALPGHGDPIDDPAYRALELIKHHDGRLDQLHQALGEQPQTAYELSFPLFGFELAPAARRFAVTETASHLERLVREERATRRASDVQTAYST